MTQLLNSQSILSSSFIADTISISTFYTKLKLRQCVYKTITKVITFEYVNQCPLDDVPEWTGLQKVYFIDSETSFPKPDFEF